MSGQAATFPMTIYSVAMYYPAVVGPEYYLTSRMLTVSGVNPLTSDEVVARARRALEADWPAGFKTAADWRFALASVTFITLEPNRRGVA